MNVHPFESWMLEQKVRPCSPAFHELHFLNTDLIYFCDVV